MNELYEVKRTIIESDEWFEIEAYLENDTDTISKQILIVKKPETVILFLLAMENSEKGVDDNETFFYLDDIKELLKINSLTVQDCLPDNRIIQSDEELHNFLVDEILDGWEIDDAGFYSYYRYSTVYRYSNGKKEEVSFNYKYIME